jgi:hypothetical protein
MTKEPENIPDWMKQEVVDKVEQQWQDNEKTQRSLEAANSVQAGGPDFWSKLTARLKINTDALPHLGEQLAGSKMVTGGMEHACHVEVNRQSVNPPPEPSQLNLFYQPGAQFIRRNYQWQELPNISLRPGNGEVVAYQSNQGPFTAEELAGLHHSVDGGACASQTTIKRRAEPYLPRINTTLYRSMAAHRIA